MYIFVYGTLRYGHERHNVLENARFVGYGFIKGFKLYDLGPYPAIAKGNGTVYGEVYEISPETLKNHRLDRSPPNTVQAHHSHSILR